MKIISKYKDYYDYLQGIYGIDNKVVLDRRKGMKVDIMSTSYDEHVVCYFAICGKLFDVVVDKQGKTYLLDNILPLTDKKSIFGGYRIKTWANRYDIVYTETRDTDLNEIAECPILFIPSGYALNREDIEACTKFPILKEWGFAGVYPSEEIFKDLYAWITKHSTPIVKDNRTDIEKIEGAGFDKIHSFRNTK